VRREKSTGKSEENPGGGSNPFLRVGEVDTPLIEAPGLREMALSFQKQHPLRSPVQIFIIPDNFVNGFNHLRAGMKGLGRKSGNNLNNI